jgi:hypothetical protein
MKEKEKKSTAFGNLVQKTNKAWRNERVGLLASEITKLILNNKIFSFK